MSIINNYESLPNIKFHFAFNNIYYCESCECHKCIDTCSYCKYKKFISRNDGEIICIVHGATNNYNSVYTFITNYGKVIEIVYYFSDNYSEIRSVTEHNVIMSNGMIDMINQINVPVNGYLEQQKYRDTINGMIDVYKNK